MAIKFKYDAAAVVPPSNETTRRFGQNLVTQQRQQDFAGQEGGYQRLAMDERQKRELRSRDFETARSNISGYAQEMMDNGEITDEPTRRKVQELRRGMDIVMGSDFTDDQRRHYLNQYNSQLAGILSSAPAKPPELTPQQKFDQGIVTRNGIDYVPGANGRYEPLELPKQPEQPEQPTPQPKTFGEYWQQEPEKARKMLADKMTEIQLSIENGDGSIAPYKSARDKALAELEQPFQIMQDAFGQPTQQPSAGVLVAPGLAQGGFARRNQPYIVGEQGPELFVPNVSGAVVPNSALGAGVGQEGIARPSASGRNNPWAGVAGGQMSIPDDNRKIPGLPAWREDMTGQSARLGQEAQDTNVRNDYNENMDKLRPGMTPGEIAAMDARTDATLNSANSQLAENQSRAAETRAGYAPRTEALRQETAQLANRNNRAESALRGELLPRSPQGDRPSRIYDISDEQDKRDQVVLDAMKVDDDAYRARMAERDATMTMRPDDVQNRIEDPTQLKRDSQQFSADYQLYKRGGGTLSTRDYIRQRAAEGSLSNDLKRQLQYNYKMDLSSGGIQDVVAEDIGSQKGAAKADAKAKRDAEDTRRQNARASINASRGYRAPPAAAPAAAPAAPPASVAAPDTTRPTRGLPGGPPTAPSQTYASPGPYRGKYQMPPSAATGGSQPTYLSDEEAADINNRFAQGQGGGQNKALPTPAQSKLPKAPKPDFGAIAKNGDAEDRAIAASLQPIYSSQTPEVQNAINVFFGPDSTEEDVSRAEAELKAAGVDLSKIISSPGERNPIGSSAGRPLPLGF